MALGEVVMADVHVRDLAQVSFEAHRWIRWDIILIHFGFGEVQGSATQIGVRLGMIVFAFIRVGRGMDEYVQSGLLKPKERAESNVTVRFLVKAT